MSLKFLTILVPQGAEYQAVCRGVKRGGSATRVQPIPVGIQPVLAALQQNREEPGPLLVMGLCGSLSPQYRVGDRVLYQNCLAPSLGAEPYRCDRALTVELGDRLSPALPQVRVLTSDRLVWSAREKAELGRQYQAQVVDMEGAAVLEVARQTGRSVAMLRVVSDAVDHDLPDLTAALDASGTLQPLPLAWGMVRQPRAALRLIGGAIAGLRQLERTATDISRLLL